jgi:hypothetical protein
LSMSLPSARARHAILQRGSNTATEFLSNPAAK